MLKRILNPFDRAGGYFAPYLVPIAALIVGIVLGFGAGWGAHGLKYNAQFFEHKYAATLINPTRKAQVPFNPRVSTTATGTVKISYYPAVGDQDGQGACAGWSTAWYLSYRYRLAHPHSWLRFSPRQMYSHYSDTYSGGQDGGSWPDQDAEISSTTGLLQFKALPEPPYQIDNPELPTYDAWGHLSTVDAAKHRFYTTFTALSGYSSGGGPGLVQAIKQHIDAGDPSLIAFPVYPEYDNATLQPNIVPPHSGEVERGGHSNVILAYDDNRLMPDGTRGAFLIQNQWATHWGINGRAWMGYSFVAQYVWGVEVAKISASVPRNSNPTGVTVKKIHAADGGHVLQAPPFSSVKSTVGSGSWFVGPIYATDRPGYRLDNLFNYWGQHYGLPPVGLAATFFAECGGKTGVNGDCDRVVYPYDISGGGCQITVGTAQSLGIGDGSNSGANINYVFHWEDNPSNCVWGEATLMHGFSLDRGGAQYPALNILWNCGPGTAEYPWPNPNDQCGVNYYQNFLGWWNYSINNFGSSSPPKPPAFPSKFYNSYRVSHHEKPFSTKGHGAQLWWTNYRKAGPVISAEQWVKPKHKHGFMTQRFSDLRLYWTPRDGHWWQRVRHI